MQEDIILDATLGLTKGLEPTFQLPNSSKSVADSKKNTQLVEVLEIQKPLSNTIATHIPGAAAIEILQNAFYQLLDERDLRPYIKPQVRYHDAKLGEVSGDALQQVQRFLMGERQSLLMLGNGGQGKTRLLQQASHQLWQQFSGKKQAMIPIFIPLTLIRTQQRQQELLSSYFVDLGLDNKDLTILTQHYVMVLFLDGYDEIVNPGNLVLSNHWERYGKNVKVITTCRQEALTSFPDYLSLFYPKQGRLGFEEMALQPFDQQQIERYIQVFLQEQSSSVSTTEPLEQKKSLPASSSQVIVKTESAQQPSWQIYLEHMQSIPNLMELVTTPIILEMVVTILPDLMKSQMTEPEIDSKAAKTKPAKLQITQVVIYDYFLKKWIEREKLRLLSRDHSSLSPDVLKHYETLVVIYAENLAHYVLYMSKFTDRMDITFSEEVTLNPQLLISKSTQKTPKLSSITLQDLVAIRSGCLLKAGAQGIFRFMHKTLIEYWSAQSLFDAQGVSLYLKVVNSATAPVGLLEAEKTIEINDYILRLNQQLLVKEPGVMRFLADRVKQNNDFEQLLFHLIEQSKSHESFAIAAANAISILALANVSLSMKDFRGIKIAGADVSGAVFDSTDFTGSDLSHVWFYRAWLKDAKFTNAILVSTKFENVIQPLELEQNIIASCFAASGEWFVLGNDKGEVFIYQTDTMEKIGYLSLGLLSVLKKLQDNSIAQLSLSHNQQYLYICRSDKLDICEIKVQKQSAMIKQISQVKIMSGKIAVHPEQLLIAYREKNERLVIKKIPDLKTSFTIDVSQINKEYIRSICFNHSGTHIAIAASSREKVKNILVFSTQPFNSKPLFRFPDEALREDEEISQIAFSFDNNALIYLTEVGLKLWKFHDNSLMMINSLNYERSRWQDTLVLQKGGPLVAVGLSHSLIVFNLLTHQLKILVENSLGESRSFVEFNAQGDGLFWGKRFYTYLNKKIHAKIKLHIHPIKNLLAVRSIGHQSPIQAMLLSEDNRTLFTGSADGYIYQWDTLNFQLINAFKPNKITFNSDFLGMGVFTDKDQSYIIIAGNPYRGTYSSIYNISSGQLVLQTRWFEAKEIEHIFSSRPVEQLFSTETIRKICEAIRVIGLHKYGSGSGIFYEIDDIIDFLNGKFCTPAAAEKYKDKHFPVSTHSIRFEAKPYGALYIYRKETGGKEYLFNRTHDVEMNCQKIDITNSMGLDKITLQLLHEKGAIGEPKPFSESKLERKYKRQDSLPLMRSESMQRIAQLEDNMNQMLTFLDQDKQAQQERAYIARHPALQSYCTMLRVELNRFMLAMEVLSTDLIKFSDDMSTIAVKGVAAAARQIPGVGLLFELVKSAFIFSNESGKLKKIHTFLLAFREVEDLSKLVIQFSRQLTIVKSQELLAEPQAIIEEKGFKKTAELYQQAKEYLKDQYKTMRIGIKFDRYEKEAICDGALFLEAFMNGAKLTAGSQINSMLSVVMGDSAFSYDKNCYAGLLSSSSSSSSTQLALPSISQQTYPLRVFASPDTHAREIKAYILQQPRLNDYCQTVRFELQRLVKALTILSTDLVQFQDDAQSSMAKAAAAVGSQIPGGSLLFEIIKTGYLMAHDNEKMHKATKITLAFREVEDVPKLIQQFAEQLTIVKQNEILHPPVISAILEEKSSSKISIFYQQVKTAIKDNYSVVRSGQKLNATEMIAVSDVSLLIEALMGGASLDKSQPIDTMIGIIIGSSNFHYEATKYIIKEVSTPAQSIQQGLMRLSYE